jgi:hypothetical protein
MFAVLALLLEIYSVEAAAHTHEHHHEMPTEGRPLTGVALSATLHCLTGCAIGEVTGMVIGTALGFSDLGTIALAVALAFLFGYTLTSLPLLRAGLAFAAVVPIALASDTISIAVMEVVDNGIMLVVPGAMEAGIGDVLFWGALSVALVIAGAAALPVNRWLIARGKGHTAVHETGIHGGPNPRVVGAIAAVAAVFGTVVLVADGFDGESAGHGGMAEHAASTDDTSGKEAATMDEHGGGHEAESADQVRGLAISEGGVSLELATNEIERATPSELRFSIVDANGEAVRDFEVEHERRMHLIIARRDLTGFQHLHPKMDDDGVWATPVEIPEAGSYRVFADFKREGEARTLAADLAVDGEVDWKPLEKPAATAQADSGYEVRLAGDESVAGGEAELTFTVLKDGEPVAVEPYLGAGGHLVALREGDLAFLHVHPLGGEHEGEDSGAHANEAEEGGPVRFMTEFPSDGRYRLFLQFKHDGGVHTAAFTREVGS